MHFLKVAFMMDFSIIMVLPSAQIIQLNVNAVKANGTANLRNAMMIPVRLTQIGITEPLMVHHMIIREPVNMYYLNNVKMMIMQ